MKILLWVVLAPVVLLVLGVGVYFLKAIVQGAVEGWRSGSDADTEEADANAAERVAALGLLPPERQHTELSAPQPHALTVALAAARAGDWTPAAALMDETAAARDWDRRTAYVEKLADVAAEDDAWLTAWEAARPDDPGAALLRARSSVSLAAKVRGSKRAQYTTAEQFDGFHRTLARTRHEHARAARLAVPGDPSPYVGEIWTAIGLGYPHEEMHRIWDEITRRAPHHYEAHFSALQYWCGKWCGSEELARAFAVKAAAGAAPGTLMAAFPLIAHFEHDESDSADVDRTPEMYAAVDAALADAAAADPAHPRLAEVRHLLAYYLYLQERWEPALEQFRLVDGYVGALPWRYRGDPAGEFCRMRDEAAVNAAAGRGAP
ncbi:MULTISPECIES: hypothetical protein [Streptomyces]|uniref:DUF4034 domain-containing protein n=1 Tax=Streptomyces sudanensis TaxID=436397 RepID=A0ABY4TBF1_9ACTN|nr:MULTISPECIES: hypothetical protein [Streptomyces]URN15248.1 hypothetical protein MW084_04015 [Streptomyces sudanensis]